jgi:hypothetical protein
MKRGITEEQIIAVLREHEAGATADLARKHGISEANAVQLESKVRRHASEREKISFHQLNKKTGRRTARSIPKAVIRWSPATSSSRAAIILNPDEEVQARLHLIFAKFRELQSARAVMRFLRANALPLPVRPLLGPSTHDTASRD